MSELYSLSNSAGIIEPGDDVLHLNKALGAKTVLRRLKGAPWLTDFLKYQWAPEGEEAYIDAYSATVRIIVTAAVLRSAHPYDLAFALGLPTIFVRMVLLMLGTVGWRYDILPDLIKYAEAPVDIASIKNMLSNFMICDFSFIQVGSLELLKAVGPELLAAGNPDFKLPDGTDVFSVQQAYNESLPPPFKDIR